MCHKQTLGNCFTCWKAKGGIIIFKPSDDTVLSCHSETITCIRSMQELLQYPHFECSTSSEQKEWLQLLCDRTSDGRLRSIYAWTFSYIAECTAIISDTSTIKSRGSMQKLTTGEAEQVLGIHTSAGHAESAAEPKEAKPTEPAVSKDQEFL